MNGKLLWGVFVVIAASAVAALIGWWNTRETHRRIPEFTLTERSGDPLTRRDLIGDVWVTGFIFTSCPGACPVMMDSMGNLHEAVPDAKFVMFTCDPENDTPEVLAEYADRRDAPKDKILFVTDTTPEGYDRMQKLAKEGFVLPGGTIDDPIVHSPYFVIVDRYGRWRFHADVTNPAEVRLLEAELKKILAEPSIPVARLPALNATLNAISGVLLVAGFLFIRARRIALHKTCMLAALVTSGIFLVSYLTYHHYAGSKAYEGEGAMRTLYFSILISHIILAALIVPLAGITVTLALRDRIQNHKALARWTLPLWLYVSVTGVVIYLMLYG